MDLVAELILQPLLLLATFGTAYVVLPLASFGKVRALFYYPKGSRRNGNSIRRLPTGQIAIVGDAAFVVGFLIWIIVGVGVWLVSR
jgi:uncharacterized protein YjeT (DUF2065 family)